MSSVSLYDYPCLCFLKKGFGEKMQKDSSVSSMSDLGCCGEHFWAVMFWRYLVTLIESSMVLK